MLCRSLLDICEMVLVDLVRIIVRTSGPGIPFALVCSRFHLSLCHAGFIILARILLNFALERAVPCLLFISAGIWFQSAVTVTLYKFLLSSRRPLLTLTLNESNPLLVAWVAPKALLNHVLASRPPSPCKILCIRRMSA